MDMVGSGDMGSDAGTACGLSMLWNWNTVDACVLSETWHIRTKAQYAGTIIGVFLIVMTIELVRRIGREYDRRLLVAHLAKTNQSSLDLLDKTDSNTRDMAKPVPFSYTLQQQALRSVIYGVQFTAAFLTMLIGMSFNGGVLFAIFLGGTVGHFAFARDAVALQTAGFESGCCC